MTYSIITPVYNREGCIARCIESVVRQLATAVSGEFEHIIVNDGSTDATGEICAEYARRYEHIQYLRFATNRGTNAGRNAAISAARGEWIIFLDSDDYFLDDAISTIDTTIKEKPNYTHYILVPNDMVSHFNENYLLRGRSERELSFVDFLSGCVAGDFTHVMSTAILRKYPFDEAVRIHEGVFFFRFYKEAQRILFTNKVVAIRERNRKDSVTRDTLRTSKEIIARIIRSKELNVEWFSSDYTALGLTNKLCEIYRALVDNYLLLGQYAAAKGYMSEIEKRGGTSRRGTEGYTLCA